MTISTTVHRPPYLKFLPVLALLAVTPVLGMPSFTPTGSMGTARAGHTATLLPSGKVLIAGGVGSNSYNNSLASAELYDPVTGTFAPTASMGAARDTHTETLLPNGKVLLTGGVDRASQNVLSSAEVYDPQTGTFSPTGGMLTTREEHTATLLPSGKVLIAGGETGNYHTTTNAELYDPATGTFTPTGSLVISRAKHTATLLPNGKVLIVAGGNWTQGVLSSAELYDPATGTFSVTGSLATGRYDLTATRLPSGEVLIVGGYNGGPLSSAELYDSATQTFLGTGSLVTGRSFPTATLLTSGNALIAGGWKDGALMSAEEYDPVTAVFTATAGMSTGLYSNTATLLPSGKVLIAGGDDGHGLLSASAELYGDAQCSVTLNPSSVNVPAAGATDQTFQVQMSAGCAWTANSNVPWITITSGASGSGPDTVTYSVVANTGSAQTGTITAGGQTFTVNQEDDCGDQLLAAQQQIQYLQTQLNAANASIQTLQTQVARLTTQNSQLQTQLNGLNNVFVTGLAALQADFRVTFKDPNFVLPGATMLEQYSNVIQAILSLNKSSKMGIYKSLGGKK